MKNTVIRKKAVKSLVSVVMPVCNAEEFVGQAIESILRQTYKNIEFIVVDDASTDGTHTILKRYASLDTRIKLSKNRTNRGISETVKRAISLAKGDYIARMDADDISLPYRIQTQVKYLKQNPNTVAVGGQCVLIDKKGQTIGKKTFPTQFKHIYKYIFEFVPVQQPTLMIATKRLPPHFEYYRDGMNTAEEVELLFKLFTYGKVENVTDPVLLYRIHDHNTSFLNIKKTFALTLISRLNAIYTYDYKPSVRGIIITILQAGCVFFLPERVTLSIYKVARSNIRQKTPSLFRTHTLSPKMLATQR